jgi:DNA primase
LEARHQQYREMFKGSPAEEYLIGRGITTETADYFKLGYVESPALVDDERYLGRLCIPYLTSSGVVQMRFRKMTDGGAKYLGDLGVDGRPFNTLALKNPARTIYLTEGEIDAMTIFQLGLPSIGIPGANLWTKLFARMFRYRSVVILVDGDTTILRDGKTAGQLFAHEVAKDLDEYRIIQMPDGEDVNSVLQKFGPDELKRKIGAA